MNLEESMKIRQLRDMKWIISKSPKREVIKAFPRISQSLGKPKSISSLRRKNRT
jgi:hypothetical protein